MKRKPIAMILFSLLLLVFAAGFLFSASSSKTPEQETIVIAMPRSALIRNMDTNYYKLWLEEQTGLSLRFLFLEDGYTPEYLSNAFANGDVRVDAFFSLNVGDDYLTALAALQDYGEKGYILPLNPYLEESTNLSQIFRRFDSYDLQKIMTASDGNLYFMPGLDASRGQRAKHVFWINKGWLSALRLSVPQTTDQLRQVLEAFSTLDPNGNGIADEIPLCGTLAADGQELYNAIINSFIYADPENSYLLLQNGHVVFAPETDAWRQAMQYLNSLYRDGLISPLLPELSSRSFSELANSPADILGGFTANRITDVLMQNSPEVISNFIHVPPLAGPEGQCNATEHIPFPNIAGVIPSTCCNPQAVFDLLDRMLSEQAFLIGRYGEETVDWETAKLTDMDFYGRNATVRIINQLANKVQNKHIGELGPFFAYPQYADGVSFAGLESDQEYINARAVGAYAPYMPDEHLGTALYRADTAAELQVLRRQIDAYTEARIVDFITGALDPFDDAQWDSVVRRYDALGLPRFLAVAQASYTEMMGD
ncbi:extracellular solute-binding protein [Ruminococcaceae bacterium OttesenSCG-928-L11]|nr:extracellular solute-binding protein [Ruminococcaceae bacterium OttesenSCG-928-L11]